MTTPKTAEIRQKLNQAFDDVALETFCFDYFPEVKDKFSRGMRKDEKITSLLDHCGRHPTGFQTLLNNVRDAYRLSNSQREELEPLIDILSNILYPITPTTPAPPPHFVGRRDILDQLKADISSGKTTLLTALQGMGGIGKTATAQKLADEVKNDFSGGIFWDAFPDHNGDSQPILYRWARICGYNLSYEQNKTNKVAIVRRLLAERQATKGSLLIILDDIRTQWLESAKLLKQALPSGASLLVTTRDKKLAISLEATVHRLDTLPLDEALRLLKAHAGEAVIEKEVEEAKNLLELIGYLPLAIKLAGKNLALLEGKPGPIIAKYWEKVRKRAIRELEFDQPRELAAIFDITYDDLPTKSQELFRCLGVFATAPLRLADVAAVANMSEDTEREMDYLVRLALVDWVQEQEGMYKLHPLVQQYAKHLLENVNETSVTERFIDHYFKMAQEATNEQDSFPAIDQAYPHILKALEKAKEQYNKKGDLARQLMIYFVEEVDRYWQVHNQYDTQVRWLNEAYDCAKVLGQPLPQASFAQRIGRALSGLGELEQGLSWLKSAESKLRGIDKIDYDSLLGLIYIHRASILYIQGTLNKAKAECIRGLSLANQHDEQAAFAEGYNLLGSIYGRSGQYKDAIEFMKTSLKLWQELGNTYQARRVESNMGMAYLYLGQLDKARQACQSAQEYWHNFPNPSKEAIMLTNLSVTSYILGQCQAMAGFSKDSVIKHYQEAQNYSNKSLIISKKLNQKRLLIVSLKVLAWPLLGLGHFEEAQVNLKNSLEIQHRSGMKIYLADTYYILAKVAVEEKQYNEAITLANDALGEIGDQGDESEKAAAYRVLGKAYRLSGELDLAQKYLDNSFMVLKEITNPFETALTWRELALLHQEQERLEEAEEAEAEVQAILVSMGIIRSSDEESSG